MKQLTNQYGWRELLLGIFAAALCLLASGCATTQPSPKPVHKNLTKQQLRHQAIKALQQDGVQVAHVGETYRLVFLTDQFFNDDSANLESNTAHTLDQAAKLIKSYDVVTVKVVGYSDNIKRAYGPANRKQALTARQAQVFTSYLWDKGINVRLAYAKGLGQSEPVAFNHNPFGRSKNRRVEISFRYYPQYPSYE